MPNDKKNGSILKSEQDEIKSLNNKIKQIAHDLNNIITSSKNSIAAIKQLIKPNDKIQKCLTNIETNSLRAAEIVEELLVSEGLGVRMKQRISTNDLIDDVLRTLRGSMGNHVDLKINISKELFKIDGFYSDLYRAFLNLSINALESLDDKGKITLTAKNVISKTAGVSVMVSIRDTGCGISEKSLKSIFSEGYSTKDKKASSGLGLHIVKNVIKNHNGKINVKSKIGKGTEFLVIIPALKSVKKISKKNKIRKILIAEDEAPILESISYLLESLNYKTLCAANGSIALDQYDDNKDIDLFIIDKLMPDMDGLEVIEKIREKNKGVPIILTTGLQDTDEAKLKKLGVNKILKKPYDFDLLIELIRGASL